MNVVEKNTEMVLLAGETAEEIAESFAKITNESYQKTETRYSEYNHDMMPFAVLNTYLREIKGKYFAEIERGFYYNPPQDVEDN